jgi:RNA polymerase sigma factor (sigma-70 family)
MSNWRGVLEQLVRERGRALFGYAYVLTGSRDEADDLLQDALVRAFKAGRSARSVDEAHVYVKKGIATAFIDHGRRAAARPRFADADLGVHASLVDHSHATEMVLDLRAAVLALGARERACIVMRYMEDLRVDDIAAALNLAPGTVKRYLHEAIQRLRAMLPELEFADLDTTDVTTLKGGAR